jgi:Uma2 family endonuclease
MEYTDPMATTLVSVEDYLNTHFAEMDREYVDGRLVERNLCERSHSYAQGEIYFFFRSMGRKNVFAYTEQRVQVARTRFRIPDVCVYIGADPEDQVFRTPPFLAVEILSKDDRPADLQEKVQDYRAFGVKFVWVVDPATRRGYVYTAEACHDAASDLWTKDPDFALPLAQLF